MIEFNWFDVVLAIILLTSAFAELQSGLARVLVNIVATIVGFIAAFWSYRMLAIKILPYVHTPTVANVLGFLAILMNQRIKSIAIP